MGIKQKIKSITEHENIPSDDKMYEHVSLWKGIYAGYHESIHELTYYTIAKGEQKRRMKTLNMAKVATHEMASLVFNEKCSISIGDGKKNDTSEYIYEVLTRGNFNLNFQEHLEYMFALGGFVLKPYYDPATKQISLSFVTADSFLPTRWENGKVTEGVFINEVFKTEGGTEVKYTLLEWHLQSYHKEKGDGYTIKNELYKSEQKTELGKEVSLKVLYPNLEPEIGIHPLEQPIFVYIRPNKANNINMHSPMGVSIFAEAVDTLELIDTAYDSLHRDFRLGKKRILVPEYMVSTITDPVNNTIHRYYNANDEIYESFGAGEQDNLKPQDITVELRVDEHVAAINALLNWYSVQTGFSAGTFSFDGQSVKTATEVVSENSKTFKSKQSHEILIEDGIRHLIKSILDLSALHKVFFGDKNLHVKVSFDDSIVEDQSAEIDKQVKLVGAKLNSRRRAIASILKITEEEALEIIEEIYKEQDRDYADIDEVPLLGEMED